MREPLTDLIVEALYGLCEGIVIGVAMAAGRGPDTGLSQAFATPDRGAWHAPF